MRLLKKISSLFRALKFAFSLPFKPHAELRYYQWFMNLTEEEREQYIEEANKALIELGKMNRTERKAYFEKKMQLIDKLTNKES